MNCHPDITLDAEDVAEPAAAVERAFRYWHSLLPGRRGVGEGLARRVLGVLAPTLAVVRSVRQTLDEREELLVQLTQEQARIIHFLDEQPHAAILGAAGTGKTLLAVEKARRLASPTNPVLYLCYNAPLREHLVRHHAQPNVSYKTFHGFARELTGRDGTLDEAARALVEHLADDGRIPYDHLVVDEAQDFDRDWLEFLRYRFRDRAFYVFYDRHQAIQGEKDVRWLDEIPCRLVLTRNCRNTDPIAQAAYRAAGLGAPVTLGVGGPRPTLHGALSPAEAVRITGALVEQACSRHNVSPGDVAVLTLDPIREGGQWDLDRIGGQPAADTPQPGHVTITTVRRFKGLEAALVIVADVDFAGASDPEWRRRLYVACSRARHAVHLVTTTPESGLGDAVSVFAGSSKTRPSWRGLARCLGVRLSGGEDDPFHE